MTSNETISYSTNSVTGGIHNVTMNFISSTNASAVFVINANNDTVLSVTFSGFTQTGAIAKTLFNSFMSIFGFQGYFANELSVFTNPTYFHSTGTAQMTFGTTSFAVTTYVANSLPETFTYCGQTATINNFSLQVGTPPGSASQFITYLHFAGTSSGYSGTYDVVFQLVTMTVA